MEILDVEYKDARKGDLVVLGNRQTGYYAEPILQIAEAGSAVFWRGRVIRGNETDPGGVYPRDWPVKLVRLKTDESRIPLEWITAFVRAELNA